jgi:hypothetical protein
MRRSVLARARPILAIGAALLLVAGLAGPATAAGSFVSPAGTACAGFDLEVAWDDAANFSSRTFTDSDGNVVRMLRAGTGNNLVFTNLTSGQTLKLRSNGSVEIDRPGPGDLWTITSLGHTVIILYPTDFPPGPSTILYTGRVVFTVDPFGTYTVVSRAGATMDICAALR